MRCIPGLETPEFVRPVVMSSDEHTEAEIVEAFLLALDSKPSAKLVTWGGEVRDLTVLHRMAEEHGLLLPPQIAELSPLSACRIDLCDAAAVRAERVHLAEYAAACSILAKPSPSKNIGKLVERADWAAVGDQVLADVMTTTVNTNHASQGQRRDHLRSCGFRDGARSDGISCSQGKGIPEAQFPALGSVAQGVCRPARQGLPGRGCDHVGPEGGPAM